MNLELFEKPLQESMREYVYRLLRINIINLNLVPGSSIAEQEIAKMLNTSRTPVREALLKLEQEHLLDIFPQKGTYISLIDPVYVAESKFVREKLESEIVKLACVCFPKEGLFKLHSCLKMQELRINEKNYTKWFELDEIMHRTIFDGCKKSRTWAVIQQLNSHYDRVRMLNLAYGYDWYQLLKQHEEIVRAIQDKNVSLGERAINIHLNKITVDLGKLQQQFMHYFVKPKQVDTSMD